MPGILIPLVILFPWLGALAIFIAASIWPVDTVADKALSEGRARWQHGLAVGFSVAGAVAALALLAFSSSDIALSIAVGGNNPAVSAIGAMTFVPDGLGVFLAVVASVIGSLCVIFSVDYMHGEAHLSRYYALVLIFIGAMGGLALSSSLLFLFFFWEITALTSYALISFNNDDPKAVAGGIKALIMTQLGGVGLLIGALVVYANLGTFQINEFLAQASSLPAGLLSLMAFGFLAAAAAKSAQVPFQTWLPDAMEAPTPVSALIHAATMVNAGVYLLARFYPAFEAVPGWKDAVVIVGVLTALLAALMALAADDLKRVLAYSTVSQLGYMVYAVGVGGVFASQFHLFSHAIFKALLFLAAGAVIHAVGTRDMRKMGELGKQMPLVRNVFVIGALALAGLPILNGFWSKELVLEAGLTGGPTWALLIMLVGAGLTALYTFRMVWMVFYGHPRSNLHVHAGRTAFMNAALVPLAVAALLSWLLAGTFASFLHGSLPYHEIHDVSLLELVKEIVTAPLTWAAMVVVGIGLAVGAWGARRASGAGVELKRSENVFVGWARSSFGFEWLNRQIVNVAKLVGRGLAHTQTGVLNWNVLGIVLGLVFVLGLLAASVWGQTF